MIRLLLAACFSLVLHAQRAPLDTLRANIERTTRSIQATWGIYIKNLDTNEEIAIHADKQMDTMSVIKIPLMAETYFQIREGKLKLDSRYTLAAEDVRPGTGVMRMFDPGATFSLKDLITLMIVVSDNTATDVLYRLTGGVEATNRRMTSLGLKQTIAPAPSKVWFDAIRAAPNRDQFHRDAKTPYGLSTPREIGILLEKMERGTLVDEAASRQMLTILRGQLYRTRIPRYLSDFPIPHKTGDFLPHIGNDVGVLEIAPDCRVVMSLFTANHFGEGPVLEEALGRIAEATAHYFTARRK